MTETEKKVVGLIEEPNKNNGGITDIDWVRDQMNRVGICIGCEKVNAGITHTSRYCKRCVKESADSEYQRIKKLEFCAEAEHRLDGLLPLHNLHRYSMGK